MRRPTQFVARKKPVGDKRIHTLFKHRARGGAARTNIHIPPGGWMLAVMFIRFFPDGGDFEGFTAIKLTCPRVWSSCIREGQQARNSTPRLKQKRGRLLHK